MSGPSGNLRVSSGQYEISNAGILCKNPSASVLIAAYNHGPFIAEAIEGAVRQVCDFDFEIIIGEDKSSDETFHIVKEYQKKYPGLIRIITDGCNVGYEDNWKRLILAARGKISDFCDGDDYWTYDRKLSEEMKIFNSSPDICIVHADHVYLHEFWGKKFIVKPRGRYADEWDKSRLKGDIRSGVFPCTTALITHTSTISFRTSCLKGYAESEESNFDGAFYDQCIVAYCSTKGKAEYIDRPVSAYRVWSGSIGKKGGEAAHIKNKFLIFSYFQALIAKHPELANFYPLHLACNRAEYIYLSSLLYGIKECSEYSERYLKNNCIFSVRTRVLEALFKNRVISLAVRLFRRLKRLSKEILYRLIIYLNIEERTEISLKQYRR